MNTTLKAVAFHQSAPHERRKFRRHAWQTAILVSPVSGHPADQDRQDAARRRTAFTGNVSLSGLQFQSRVSYPLGRLVSIDFTIGIKPYRVIGCIKRSRAVWSRGRLTYDCAAQFVRGRDVEAFILALARYLSRTKAAPIPDEFPVTD